MAETKNREIRMMDLKIEKREENQEPSYIVKGYAATFEPYVLFEDDGIKYSEQIDPHAFDECDMSDVVFRFDHAGKVYARSSAGTVKLFVDDHGLGNETDLSKTAAARDAFEEIAAGNYPKMSFAFTVREDAYDTKTHTRTINKIDKVYDVSPVAFPANPGTEISVATRAYFDGVIKQEQAERLEAEKREQGKRKLALRIRIGGYLDGD